MQSWVFTKFLVMKHPLRYLAHHGSLTRKKDEKDEQCIIRTGGKPIEIVPMRSE